MKSSPSVKNWYEANQKLIITIVPFAFLAVLVVVFTATNPRFFSLVNLFNLIRQSSVLLLVAIGGSFVILMGSIDLSVGEIVGFVALITALFAKQFGLGAWIVLVGAGLGAFCGLANGLLNVYLKIPSFLATLGTMTVLFGISDFLFRNGTIFYNSKAIDWIASGNLIWQIPNSGVFSLAIFCIAALVALRTPFGRYMYAIGSGERVARFSGIRVNWWKLAAFLTSGLFSGMAGVLLLARTRNGTARMGEGILTDAIAAIVIGGTPLTGGAGGVHLTIIGVLIITVLSNGMNVAGVQLYVQIVIKGIVMMLAVALTLDRSRIEFVK